MDKNMVLSELAMQRLEQSIPESAGPAFKRAYQHALSSGGTVSINPHLFSKMPFDPVKDLTPVAAVAAAN